MIYFIKCGEYVKIGHSGQVRHRLNELRSSNPAELELLFCLDGGLREESGWHIRFVKYHHRNEWFYLAGELAEFVKEHIGQIGNGSVTKPYIARRRCDGRLTLHGLTWNERMQLLRATRGEEQ